MEQVTDGKEETARAKQEMAFQAFEKEARQVFIEMETGIVESANAIEANFMEQEEQELDEVERDTLRTACEMKAFRHEVLQNLAAAVVHVRQLTQQNAALANELKTTTARLDEISPQQ